MPVSHTMYLKLACFHQKSRFLPPSFPSQFSREPHLSPSTMPRVSGLGRKHKCGTGSSKLPCKRQKMAPSGGRRGQFCKRKLMRTLASKRTMLSRETNNNVIQPQESLEQEERDAYQEYKEYHNLRQELLTGFNINKEIAERILADKEENITSSSPPPKGLITCHCDPSQRQEKEVH